MSAISFTALFESWTWRPIRGCPGRFVLAADGPPVTVEKLVGEDVRPCEHRVAAARDLVVVIAFDGGGLISYRRDDGSYVHTLNNRAGFARKLRQLGIEDGSVRGGVSP